MRNTLLILVLVFFAASCEKDLYLEGGPTNGKNYGRNNVEVGAVQLPFSATFTTISDGSLICLFKGIETLKYLCGTENGSYIAGGGPITGNATHVGLIQENLSSWKVTDFDLIFGNIGTDEDPVIGPISIIEYIEGEIHSANGDYYTYEGEAIVSLVGEPVLSGEMRFTGGTGRFEGVSGSIQLSGTADFETGSATFKGNGVIIYPR